MRLTKFFPALVMSAALLVGCMAPQTGLVPTTAPKGGAVGFFDQVNGMGAITIRLIDNRRSTQAFADAADFNAVRFELRNASKLKAPRIRGTDAAGDGKTYGTVFTDLPSDTYARYTLTAGLFSGVTSPTDPNAPEYSNLDRKVGEGASVAFSIEPGESKTITLVINAVGDFSVDSSNTNIDMANPTFVASDNTATAQLELSSLTNPGVTNLRYSVVSTAGATASTQTLLPENWQAPPAKTSLPFVVPSTPGNYNLVIDLTAGVNVLSRRSRQFTVEAPASVGSEFTDPTPAPSADFIHSITGNNPSFALNGAAFSTTTTVTVAFSPLATSASFTNNSDTTMLVLTSPLVTPLMAVLNPGQSQVFNSILFMPETFTVTPQVGP